MKMFRQDNVQNQFIAFRRVAKENEELKAMIKKHKDKNQVDLLKTQQQFYKQMGTISN